ncbi:hypothetical protein FBULB1_8622 [Fusarium bulbicola]|nr:hypothetical protein FBULB1_8622 [Fusarium bulbicola]
MEEPMEIELEPRAAIRAGKAPKASNDMAELEPPQADTDDGDGQFSITSSQDPKFTAQSIQSSPGTRGVPGQLGQEEESQSHTSQEAADENVHPIGLTPQILLLEIKERLLSKIDRGRLVEGNSDFGVSQFRWLQDRINDDNSSIILGSFWWMSSDIRNAWPESRHVEGIRQYLIEDENSGPKVQAHLSSNGWSPPGDRDTPYDTIGSGVQGFPVSLLACALSFEEPFRLSRDEMDHLDVRKSTPLLSAAFRSGYSVQSDHDLHNTIHWQVRYLSPMHEYREDGIECLLSERETVTLQYGSVDKTALQEKRAMVTFRVLRDAPKFFSVLVLKDEEILTDTQSPYEQFHVNMFWKGYGFLPRSELEDLDNFERVEELMFDNSFKRSKNYFVALQLLRIIDEWLDEAQSTVEDMFKDPVLLQASMCARSDESDTSFEIAIRYVNEQAAATKSRVRKKQEEINSLRDGLFNATSLRESTKAMALNQAIYVFTVVTVLFTPVSFLATFWALPFLNNPVAGSDTIPEPSAFRNSFIIMPLLTYALVIGVACTLGDLMEAHGNCMELAPEDALEMKGRVSFL